MRGPKFSLAPPPTLVRQPQELAAMRQAGRLVAQAHAALRAVLAPGVRLRDLDALALEVIEKGGGRPAFMGVKASRPGVAPFPGTACLSVNEEVVHGLPKGRRLAEGDLLTVDLGAEWGGHYGDSAWTWPVGEVSEEALRLLAAGEAALWAGIAAAQAGAHLEAISAAVQDASEGAGFALVQGYGGHGIGRVLHGDPHVPNQRSHRLGPKLVVGQGLAIEPMLTTGSGQVKTKADGWTVATREGALAVHFEHSILVREGPAEVLTLAL